jgi:hypothetical protein
MSFNIYRGTLGSLAMFTAIRNASSRVSSFAEDRPHGSATAAAAFGGKAAAPVAGSRGSY